MNRIIALLLAFCSICHSSHSVPVTPQAHKLDKPLFVPSVSYSNLYQLHPTSYGSGGLDVGSYPRYRTYYEYTDLLQKQPIYPSFEKRLEDILLTKDRRTTIDNSAVDEDEYKHKANNLLNFDQMKPESEDLDRRYKRGTSNVTWNSATSKLQNLENQDSAINSRSVSIPFGPYTTWLPYKGPSDNSHFAPHNTNALNDNRRSRRQEELNTNSILPSENYWTTFPREIPVQFSIMHEPVYPINRKTLENLPRFSNSLSMNTAQADFNDQMNLN